MTQRRAWSESFQDCSEDDEGEYSSEGDEEGDTEELDEEEMCLPGMDGKEEVIV